MEGTPVFCYNLVKDSIQRLNDGLLIFYMATPEHPYPRSILPADWDQPSEGNAALAALFAGSVFHRGDIHMPYRLFTPETPESVPLVIYLHGADAIGRDNESQLSLHDIGTMFADPAWQKSRPCCILAPQYGPQEHWSDPRIISCTGDLIDDILKNDKRIDPKRLYLYGYSAGGLGVMSFIRHRPAFYAAAISICGAVSRHGLEQLTGTPLWLFHAADDRIVKCAYADASGEPKYYMGSREIYAQLKDVSGCEIRYTEFPEGYMKSTYGVNPHCSWVCVSGREGVKAKEWMFGKVRT